MDVRTKPSRAGLSDLLSALIRRALTEIVIGNKSY
jgi:hypothetical protein